VSPRAILFLLLIFPAGIAFAQPKTHREVVREVYPGTQKVKSITETRVMRNMHGDLFNYYKKTTLKRVEFAENGKPVKAVRRVTKLGRSGKPCYELYSREVLYDELGRKKHDRLNKCDKQKWVEKEYVEGRLVFIRKYKRRRPWSGFWFFS